MPKPVMQQQTPRIQPGLVRPQRNGSILSRAVPVQQLSEVWQNGHRMTLSPSAGRPTTGRRRHPSAAAPPLASQAVDPAVDPPVGKTQ